MSLGMYASPLLCEYYDVLLPEMFRVLIYGLISFIKTTSDKNPPV